MTITTVDDAIKAAASIARDVAEGRLTPAQLEAQARAEVLTIAGEIVGEGDPLWDVQLGIARGVLAAGGIPADELSEWLAVARHRAGQPVTPPDAISLPSGAQSPENDDAEPEPEPEPALEPVADTEPEPAAPVAPQPNADGYDPTRGWQPGNSRRY